MTLSDFRDKLNSGGMYEFTIEGKEGNIFSVLNNGSKTDNTWINWEMYGEEVTCKILIAVGADSTAGYNSTEELLSNFKIDGTSITDLLPQINDMRVSTC